MFSKIVGAFIDQDIEAVKNSLSENSDLSTLEAYVRNLDSKKLSTLQSWLLQEIYGTRDNGLGVYKAKTANTA